MNAQSMWKSTIGDALILIFVTLLIILLAPIWLPFLLLMVGVFLAHRSLLYVLIWLLWLPRGKDVLFVSSESPIWKEYMLEEILPLVHNRSVALNWSERKHWSRLSISVQAFRAFGGEREFNPMVIVFRPFQLARTFRFWPAFKAWKHGDRELVAKLRQELTLIL